MIFKSRFAQPRLKPATYTQATLTAEYTDRAELEGQSLSLRDLRDLVHSVPDWPDSAVVDVRRWPSMSATIAGTGRDNIGIVVKVRENE